MSIPVWILLGFALWTLLTLLCSVGIYRWSRILTGRAGLSEFPADVPHGKDWYRRAMRAHANCVASGVRSPSLDVLAIVLLAARVCQTITHIAFEQTNFAVGVRFSFFFVQLLSMLAMSALVRSAPAVRIW